MHLPNHFLRVLMTLVATKNIVKGTYQGEYINPDVESVIHNRLKSFIATNSLQSGKNHAIEETTVEKAINNKIEELKPYLQDDIIDICDKITIQGQDDKKDQNGTGTKGKKSLRDDRTKEHIETYKKWRNKIDKALKLEFISDKTHDLTIRAFDNLIAKLNTCNWKSGNKVRTSKILNDLWNEEWKRLKTNYLEKLKLSNPERMQDIKSFFDGLYTFFSFIVKDMGIMSDKYKIKCKFMDTPTYRKHDDFECESDSDFHHTNCKRFIICSRELKIFFLDFYNFLNDTTVSVITDYAEMYDRDADSFVEKPDIVASINATSTIMEKVVVETFIKNIKSFELDINKDKEENIKALSSYVKATILEVRDNAKIILNKELKGNKAKTSSSVKDDLNLSIKIDLENLQREVLGRICFIFRLCNGKYKSRRNADIDGINNDIYVKVESDLKQFFNLSNFKNLEYTSKKFINTTYSYATGKVTRTSPFRVIVHSIQ